MAHGWSGHLSGSPFDSDVVPQTDLESQPANRTRKPSFVRTLPTPRFYQPVRDDPTATAGCLYRVRHHLFVIRWFLGVSHES